MISMLDQVPEFHQLDRLLAAAAADGKRKYEEQRSRGQNNVLDLGSSRRSTPLIMQLSMVESDENENPNVAKLRCLWQQHGMLAGHSNGLYYNLDKLSRISGTSPLQQICLSSPISAS
jgi:hypothetical protein